MVLIPLGGTQNCLGGMNLVNKPLKFKMRKNLQNTKYFSFLTEKGYLKNISVKRVQYL